MFPDYDEHLGLFDEFNKEIFMNGLGFEPMIKKLFIHSEFLIKYDLVEENYYVTSNIPVYITIEHESKDVVYLVLLNEYIYLNDNYPNESEFELKINEIETTLKNSLLN